MKKQLLFSVLAFAVATANFAQNGNSGQGQAIIPWKANGNQAASEHFIGTTNQTDLVFKSNSLEGIRLVTDGSLRLEQLKLQPGEETLDLPRLMSIKEDGTVTIIQGKELAKLAINIAAQDALLGCADFIESDPNKTYTVKWCGNHHNHL